jgi:hypothetical protein
MHQQQASLKLQGGPAVTSDMRCGSMGEEALNVAAGYLTPPHHDVEPIQRGHVVLALACEAAQALQTTPTTPCEHART